MHTFEITVQRRSGQTWPVLTEECEQGVLLPVTASGTLAPDLDALATARPDEYGVLLGQSLFRDQIATAFAAAMGRTLDDLHLLLHIEDPELIPLRWERLCAPIDGPFRSLA